MARCRGAEIKGGSCGTAHIHAIRLGYLRCGRPVLSNEDHYRGDTRQLEAPCRRRIEELNSRVLFRDCGAIHTLSTLVKVLESRKQLRGGTMRAGESDSADSLAYVLTMSLLFVTVDAMTTAKFWLGIGILCTGILVFAAVSI